MRLLRRFPLGLLLLALPASCSHPTQAASPAPAPQPVQTAVAASTPKPGPSWPVIVAFGDSLTAGYGPDSGLSYPDYLQRDLVRDGYRYRVVNLGVGGNTTKDGLERVKDVLGEHPRLVIVGFGGNDGLRGVPVGQMRANLDEILDAFAKARIPVVIGGITLPPNYGAAYVRQFNAVYPLLARKYHAPLMPFMLNGIWDHPEMMQQDGIHPTAVGNEVMARNFLPLVEAGLKKNIP